MISTEQFAETLFLFVSKQLIKELKRQGHVLTGALIKSLDFEVRKQVDSISIDFLMLKYGRSLNDGIPPERIPYTIGRSRGGKSKYIQGLIRFATLRFKVGKKEATSIAFAIATKHKKEGYPLTKKIKFIDNSIEANKAAITKLIADFTEATIYEMINQFKLLQNGNN